MRSVEGEERGESGMKGGRGERVFYDTHSRRYNGQVNN